MAALEQRGIDVETFRLTDLVGPPGVATDLGAGRLAAGARRHLLRRNSGRGHAWV